jgi:large subunit ribosomal protein L17
MRHRLKGRKLNRTASHKKALIRNLANQLFEHKEIRTTTAKAKEARITIERLITYAKKGDTHHRRLAFSFLRQKDSIKILFDEIAPAYSERQGGYTRVIKLGRRQGDGAPIAILQLVGFETLADTSKPEKKKKTRKKEEKHTESETKATDSKESKIENIAPEEVEQVEDMPEKDVEEKSAEDKKQVEDAKISDESTEAKKETQAEGQKAVEEEKPVKDSKSVEDEIPAKEESNEKSPEEVKTDNTESEEDKKEK